MQEDTEMASEFEITKKSVLADILRQHPQCIEVLEGHGMACRTCMGVSTDTVEEGALMHDVDTEKIVTELRMCCERAEISPTD